MNDERIVVVATGEGLHVFDIGGASASDGPQVNELAGRDVARSKSEAAVPGPSSTARSCGDTRTAGGPVPPPPAGVGRRVSPRRQRAYSSERRALTSCAWRPTSWNRWPGLTRRRVATPGTRHGARRPMCARSAPAPKARSTSTSTSAACCGPRTAGPRGARCSTSSMTSTRCTSPAGRPGLVLVAAFDGFGMSRDGGETWTWENEGLHAHYCRAVALGRRHGDSERVDRPSRASRGVVPPVARGRGTFERCADGLPDGSRTTSTPAASPRTATPCHRHRGRVRVPLDRCRPPVGALAKGLAPVRAVALS